MNKALLNKEVQEFLEENYKEDISKILFRGSHFSEVSPQELGVQLKGKKRAEKKLPTWFKTRNIIYPPNINLEQTSSEVTAEYKASLVGGKSLVDLTGGFGIDDYYFSKKLERVVHCELNKELSEIAAHNFEVLDAVNIKVEEGDGLNFLKNSSEKFDWIYVDPSRRDDIGGRVFFLEDCLPNVPENLELIWKKTDQLLIKTSPLLDLQAGKRALDNVQEIHVVAVNNEVKELLWVSKKTFSGPVKIKAVNFRKGKIQTYENFAEADADLSFGHPGHFLYEPNAALMKSGLADALAKELDLVKLHPNSQLYTSHKRKKYFGRTFKVIEVVPFKKKTLKKHLDFSEAHITTRNFPESVDSLRKMLKLKDGGENYLFFTTLSDEKRVMLVCRKVSITPAED